MQASRNTNVHRPPSRAAFTLIEMLVATAVLALLVVLLMEVVNRASATWVQAQGQVERRHNGRAIADFIGQELQAALLPVDPTGSSNKLNLQFVLNPKIGDGDAVFWQAPLATDQTNGDIAEIGYFLKWTGTTGTPHGQLCRFFVNPTPQGVPNSNYLI